MIIDILVAIALFFSAVIAFLRGFIRESLTIVGFVGGTAAAYAAGPLLDPLMRSWMGVPADDSADMPKLFDLIPMDLVAKACAYLLIFVVVMGALSILSYFLCGFVKKIGLGPVDRTLGVIFGLVRGALLLALAYVPVHMIFPQDRREEWFKGSRSFVYLEQAAEAMVRMMPEDMAKSVTEQAAENGEKASDAKERVDAIQRLKEQAESVGAAMDKAAPDDQTGGQPLQTAPPAQPAPEGGYDPNQRNQMDQLMNENAQ